MTSEWDIVTIEKITSKLGDGLHGTPTYSENGEYYFINGNNLCDGRIVFDEKTKRCDAKEFEKYQKPLGKRTILVSINGTLGNVAYYNDENVILGKSACYFNLKKGIEKRFVGYIVSSSIFQRYLEQIATGTTIKNVSLKSMREFSFKLPSPKEQKAIASVLGTLDDKIENNRRMNKTLEEMARAIFKSWFVDFDPVHAKAAGNAPAHMDADTAALFPSSFGDDGLPVGWNIGKIENILDRQRAGKLFSKKIVDTNGLVPVLDQSGADIIGFHNEGPSVLASASDRIITFANHTCVLRLIDFNFSAIQNVIPFKGKGYPTEWVLFASHNKQKFEEYKGHWPTFVVQPVILPDIKTSTAFAKLIEPVVVKISTNKRENEALAELRDTLLPKLMSGEVRVKNNEASGYR